MDRAYTKRTRQVLKRQTSQNLGLVTFLNRWQKLKAVCYLEDRMEQ